MSDEKPLGVPGKPTLALRLRHDMLLRGENPDTQGGTPIPGARLRRDDRPSLPWRSYRRGDAVAINEVVFRNVATGDMVVVYPGSQEAAARSWPQWTQVLHV